MHLEPALHLHHVEYFTCSKGLNEASKPVTEASAHGRGSIRSGGSGNDDQCDKLPEGSCIAPDCVW